MESIFKKMFFGKVENRINNIKTIENIGQGKIDVEYRIKEITTSDDEMRNFLFSLGCYEGESITLISILGSTFVVNIKDARYSIDKNLASTIKVEVA